MGLVHGRTSYLAVLFIVCIVGVGFLLIGWGQIQDYNNGSAVQSETQSKGVSLDWSNPEGVWGGSFKPLLKNIQLTIYMRLPDNFARVTLEFSFLSMTNHSFMIVLPFNSTNARLSGFPNYNSQGDLNGVAFPNLTKSSSAILFTFIPRYNESDYFSETCSFDLTTVGNLVSDERGNIQFYLPLGQTPPDDVRDASARLRHGFMSPSLYNASVYVDLPSGLVVENAFPPFGSLSEPSSSSSGQSMSWKFVTPNTASPITISYRNNHEVDTFSNYLFYGGLFLGVGVSSILAPVPEIAREFLMSRGNRKDNELKNSPVSGNPDSKLSKFVSEFGDVIDENDLRIYFSTKMDSQRDILTSSLSFIVAIVAVGLSAVAVDIRIVGNPSSRVVNALIEASPIIIFLWIVAFVVFTLLQKNNLPKKHEEFFREYLEFKRKLKRPSYLRYFVDGVE